MDGRIYLGPNRINPAGPSGKPAQEPGRGEPRGSFQGIFEQELSKAETLKFSGHAQERLSSSRLKLTDEDLAKLHDAVQRAAQKGARESLILLRDMALVVSIKNRTVITAIDGQRMKENIFTNIDSAVIL